MLGIYVVNTFNQMVTLTWHLHALTEKIFRIESVVCQLSKDVEVPVKATSLNKTYNQGQVLM